MSGKFPLNDALSNLDQSFIEAFKNYYVLFIDDENLSCKYFSKFFDTEKFCKILTATSAEEGLEMIDKYGDQIAVVMTDQMMPLMNGNELLAQTKIRIPLAIKILTSVMPWSSVRLEYKDVDVDFPFVAKPWDSAEVVDLVTKAAEFFILRTDKIFESQNEGLKKITFRDWMSDYIGEPYWSY